MKRRRLIAAVVPLLSVVIFMLAWPSGPTVVERSLPAPGAGSTLDTMLLRSSSGFRAFSRGFRASSEVRYPRLPATNLFWSAVNGELEDRARNAGRAFGDQVTWPLFRTASREPSPAFDWQLEVTWQARWVSAGFVSLSARQREYTGGTPGNELFGSLNVVPDDFGSWKGVTLGQFFDSTSGWRKPVLEQVTADLNRRQKRDRRNVYLEEPATVSITADQLRAVPFTAGVDGITLWFAPRDIGSYAEGSFEVLLAYQTIRPLLDTNGPAKWLPCFPSLQ